MSLLNYSKEVEEKRIEIGFTKTEFAKYCHVNIKTLHKILLGDCRVRIVMLFEILTLLNIPRNHYKIEEHEEYIF